MDSALQFAPPSPALLPIIERCFERILKHGLDRDFHPHPFTEDQASKLANYQGKDYYVWAIQGNTPVGYGMLRGWDDGYAIPSLGIVVLPDFQRRGLGRMIMLHLHEVARARGAPRIRLKVYARNINAAALYESLGYRLEVLNEKERLGFFDLPSRTPPE